MRRWIAPLAFLGVTLAMALWYQAKTAPPPSRFPAPDFTLPDLDGATHRLSSFRGQVILLNVWVTWCAPCREEMPTMEALHQRLAEEDFVLLAVSEDEAARSAVQPYVEELGLTFPVLLDPAGEVSRKFGVTGYPESFLIDKQGMVILHHIGFQDWADRQVETMIRRLLAAHADGDRGS